jgi:hypothetical protein
MLYNRDIQIFGNILSIRKTLGTDVPLLWNNCADIIEDYVTVLIYTRHFGNSFFLNRLTTHQKILCRDTEYVHHQTY